MANEINIVHLVAAPPNDLDAELLNKAAAVIDKDPYTTRLLLTGKIPKILTSYQTIEDAESAARSIGTLGLIAFVCSDTELRTPFSSHPAFHTLKPANAEVTLLKSVGETQTLKAEDVFLILKGTRQTNEGKQSAITTRKLNLSATLLTGIPVFRKVKGKSQEEYQNEGFLRIYDLISSQPRVEIPQHGFDYSFLGARLAPNSYQNMNSTADVLKEIFPNAVYDDTLTAHTDATDVNCRLVYLYHKTKHLS